MSDSPDNVDRSMIDVLGWNPMDPELSARLRPENARRAEEFLREKYGDDWRRHSPYPEHWRPGEENELVKRLFAEKPDQREDVDADHV